MSQFEVPMMEKKVRKFNMNLIRNLRPDHFEGLGVMDSRKYRQKFEWLSANLTIDSLAMVVVFATIVKNMRRLLNVLQSSRDE